MTVQGSPGEWRLGELGGSVVTASHPSDCDGTEEKYYGGHLVLESCVLADRRRILACIRLFEGIPTEAIEELKDDSLESARKFVLRLSGGNPT